MVAAVAAWNANSKHSKSSLNGEIGSMREKAVNLGCGARPDFLLGHDHLELKTLHYDDTGDVD